MRKTTKRLASVTIDARGLRYRDVNAIIKREAAAGAEHINLLNVTGQRYIGTGLAHPVTIDIYGTPGNDLGAFMNGPTVFVHGNAQDGCGNTMDGGEIVIHGHAGDIAGFAMRGGRIFIRDDVGYRVGIHMKEYRRKVPVLVVGGTSQDFLAEYMAGGVLVLLGLTLPQGTPHHAEFVGTGMHGGVVYLRGDISPAQLGREVGVLPMTREDYDLLKELVRDYTGYFGGDAKAILAGRFTKLVPITTRPYGRLYAY